MVARSRPPDCCAVLHDPLEMAAPLRNRAVAIFRALGDATRFEIFRLIAAQDAPVCVCDVVGCFELTQPTISYHLKLLREAGLVSVSQRGVWAYYTATPEGQRFLKEVTAVLSPSRVGEVA